MKLNPTDVLQGSIPRRMAVCSIRKQTGGRQISRKQQQPAAVEVVEGEEENYGRYTCTRIEAHARRWSKQVFARRSCLIAAIAAHANRKVARQPAKPENHAAAGGANNAAEPFS